jgi:hypothetical protein
MPSVFKCVIARDNGPVMAVPVAASRKPLATTYFAWQHLRTDACISHEQTRQGLAAEQLCSATKIHSH